MTDTDDSTDDVNVSRLREMAVRGKEYREQFEVEYMGEMLDLQAKSIPDLKFLPIAAQLEDKLDMDKDEAAELLEEEKESGEDDSIDPSNFDREFVSIMAEAAVIGIDREYGDAEGETEDGLREIFGISEDDDENIGLVGGTTLVIAERVLNITSDAEKAENFRRDGGRQ